MMNYVGGETTMNLGKELDDQQAIKAFNQAVNDKRDIVKEEIDRKLQKGKEMLENSQNLEIVPTNSFVLVQPFAENPFEAMKEENGIIIPVYDGKFQNPDTGEEDQEYNLSRQAEVIEVGPNVTYIKPGDVIYYNRHCGVPIPFFGQGIEVVNESQIHVVINEGVKARFEKIKNGRK